MSCHTLRALARNEQRRLTRRIHRAGDYAVSADTGLARQTINRAALGLRIRSRSRGILRNYLLES